MKTGQIQLAGTIAASDEQAKTSATETVSTSKQQPSSTRKEIAQPENTTKIPAGQPSQTSQNKAQSLNNSKVLNAKGGNKGGGNNSAEKSVRIGTHGSPKPAGRGRGNISDPPNG